MEQNPNTQEELAAEIDKEFSAELLKEENTVEALLFTMGRSVSVEEIAIALNTGTHPARDAAERLRQKYMERQGGILIERLENRYQMCTNPSEFPGLIRVAKQPKKPVLTDVVMETLAIIAYKQPITKAEIERIRGVKSDHAVNRLVEYELIYEVGRLDAPGRPALFATSEEFLRRFGVQSLRDLPELSPEVEKAIETEVSEEIADVLGVDEDNASEREDAEKPGTTVNAEQQGLTEEAVRLGGAALTGILRPVMGASVELSSADVEAPQSLVDSGSGAEAFENELTETDESEVTEVTDESFPSDSDEFPEESEEDEEWLEQMIYEAAMGESEATSENVEDDINSEDDTDSADDEEKDFQDFEIEDREDKREESQTEDFPALAYQSDDYQDFIMAELQEEEFTEEVPEVKEQGLFTEAGVEKVDNVFESEKAKTEEFEETEEDFSPSFDEIMEDSKKLEEEEISDEHLSELSEEIAAAFETEQSVSENEKISEEKSESTEDANAGSPEI